MTDDDLDGAYGFEPAVSATGAERDSAEPAAAPARATRRTRTRTGRGAQIRRRVGAVAVLFGALSAMGGAYAAFATSSTADDRASSAQDIEKGRQIYQVACITCHGNNLEGVSGQGPSLVQVGGASVYFQVSTGRMPLAAHGAYAPRKQNRFDETSTEQLAAYIQSVGGGPQIPSGALRVSTKEMAQGGALFRLNCASCHGVTFHGSALSAGKIIPSLYQSTDKQIWTAMLSGPENMPVFSDNEITPDEKREIVTYVQSLKASKDPGGSGIGRVGPVSEAIVIWVGGVGLLMGSILWIGARSR